MKLKWSWFIKNASLYSAVVSVNPLSEWLGVKRATNIGTSFYFLAMNMHLLIFTFMPALTVCA